MAVGIHVVYVVPRHVSPAGVVFEKNAPTTLISDVMNGSMEPRVQADAAIASSSGDPSIKTYLEREAAIDFVLHHLSNTMIVTYDAGGINAAS